jgi:hypothetical protein
MESFTCSKRLLESQANLEVAYAPNKQSKLFAIPFKFGLNKMYIVSPSLLYFLIVTMDVMVTKNNVVINRAYGNSNAIKRTMIRHKQF